MSKIKPMVGKRFGMLLVVAFSHVDNNRYAIWKVACDCGKEHSVSGVLLRRGEARSCGCQQYAGLDTTLHGETSNRQMTREYRIWLGMKQRCENPKHKNYADYGARGIRVCEQWRNSFENFLSDIGRAPSNKHTIDRILNDRGYEPDNVRWATRREQSHNSSNTRWIEYKGDRRTVGQWAEYLDIPASTISARLQRGWTEHEALEGKRE